MSFESPPSVSGVVVLSGSNDFSVTSSDFPIITNLAPQSYTIAPTVYESTSSGTSERSQVVASGSVGNLAPQSYGPALTVYGLTSSGTSERSQVVASGSVGNLAPQSYTAIFPTVYGDAVVIGYPDDWSITTTETTTSGVVVFQMGIGIGTPYVVPIVIDARLFPVSLASFPTTFSGERIYPVLPQYSIIIP